ncbi:50S ribosomal protein L25 [Candidatus Daviesbacteria bacterium]|nr:50S ribosomal protein L25 [Candidatus Daviesbacteria bacterium]
MTNDRVALKAEERTILGKKVKALRKNGKLPGHVYGKGVETEHVTVDTKEFLKIAYQAGETGLVDLRIGQEKIRPVLIREIQTDPISGSPVHIDFYQVNLKEKVVVPVPLVLIGQEPEKVHLGEAIVLQTLNEVQVEALPADLIEKIEVNIATLKEIDDAISVENLSYDRSKLTILAEPESIVVKLAPAVSAAMEQLLEEQAAEAAAATAVEGETPVEGEAAEGETPAEGEEQAQARAEGEEIKSEESPEASQE